MFGAIARALGKVGHVALGVVGLGVTSLIQGGVLDIVSPHVAVIARAVSYFLIGAGILHLGSKS